LCVSTSFGISRMQSAQYVAQKFTSSLMRTAGAGFLSVRSEIVMIAATAAMAVAKAARATISFAYMVPGIPTAVLKISVRQPWPGWTV
jgi:hypothetical protein